MKLFFFSLILFKLCFVNGVISGKDAKLENLLASIPDPEIMQKKLELSTTEQERLLLEFTKACENLFSASLYVDFTNNAITPLGYWQVDYALGYELKRAPNNTLKAFQFTSDNPDVDFTFVFAASQAKLRYIITDPNDIKVKKVMRCFYELDIYNISSKDYWEGWTLVLNPGKELSLVSITGQKFEIVSVSHVLNKLLSTDHGFKLAKHETTVHLTGPPPSLSIARHKYLKLRFSGYQRDVSVFCKRCSSSIHAYLSVNNALILQLSTPISGEKEISIDYIPKNSFYRKIVSIATMSSRIPTLKQQLISGIRRFGKSLKNVRISNLQIKYRHHYETTAVDKILNNAFVLAFKIFFPEDSSHAIVYARVWEHVAFSAKSFVIRFHLSWKTAKVPKILKINRTVDLNKAQIKSEKDTETRNIRYSINGLFNFGQYYI